MTADTTCFNHFTWCCNVLCTELWFKTDRKALL